MGDQIEQLGVQSQDLAGESILITGASSGLGAHFAKCLGMRGANVALAARSGARLAKLEGELSALGIRACCVEMNVANAKSVADGFRAVQKEIGPLTGTVANAGVNIEGSVLQLSEAEIAMLLSVNVQGALLTARESARQMIENLSSRPHNGKIVLVSSITANQVSKGIALYSASKAAVQQLGRCLAADWSRKEINVNVVCPGYIETPLNRDWFKTCRGQMHVNSWPRRQLMAAEDLDGIMCYLMSPASDKTTGGVFTVDDGQSLA